MFSSENDVNKNYISGGSSANNWTALEFLQ